VPKVFLCSRTHSQLRQLLAELKSTPYRPKYTVLGSRQQFCDKREVVRSKGGADLACKLLVRVWSSACGEHSRTPSVNWNKPVVVEEAMMTAKWCDPQRAAGHLHVAALITPRGAVLMAAQDHGRLPVSSAATGPGQ
jgi:Rad3-related DNA helicase